MSVWLHSMHKGVVNLCQQMSLSTRLSSCLHCIRMRWSSFAQPCCGEVAVPWWCSLAWHKHTLHRFDMSAVPCCVHKAKLLQNVMCAFPDLLQQVCLNVVNKHTPMALASSLSSLPSFCNMTCRVEHDAKRTKGHQGRSISTVYFLYRNLNNPEHDAERVEGCQGRGVLQCCPGCRSRGQSAGPATAAGTASSTHSLSQCSSPWHLQACQVGILTHGNFHW